MSWLVQTLGDGLLWVLLGIPVFLLCRQAPMDRIRWPAGLSIHLLGAGIFSTAHTLGSVVLSGRTVNSVFEARFHWNVVIYLGIAAASHAWIYYRNNERNQALLAEAELQALKMQLQPHFLFNTLETISALMYRDVDAADRIIARLGDLLRHSLRNSSRPKVTLREELDFLRSYLEIEQTRFPDRLKVELDIDPATLDATVPNLILQPLVENAIRHGIACQIVIRARREESTLAIEVRDDGSGMKGEIAEGVGLSNTRLRLQHMYGDRGRFQLRNGRSGGVIASLAMPFLVEQAR